jgi:hypothetical protein
LTEIRELKHNLAMSIPAQFALDLITAGHPYLAAVVIAAIALRLTLPIRFSLSIGDRTRKASDDAE